MRSLLPPDVDADDLYAVYGDAWLAEGGVRANFVTSVDGAISANGLSRGLQTPGDNRVFAAIRDLADVVLVGSGTAQAEGYEPVRLSARRTRLRIEHGRPGVLTTAVVSGSLHLDPASPLLADPATIVLTTARAPLSAREALAAEVVVCGDDHVDLALALAALRERGLTHVVCEGGPSLLASLIDAGLLDELCLSLSPVLAGPGAGRMTSGAPWDAARSLRLTGLLEEDGALFCRYRLG